MYKIAFIVWLYTVCYANGQQETFTSGNDYHCNPSFHVHPNTNGCTGNEFTAAPCQPATLPRDCSEVSDRGNTHSGQYIISPQDDGPPFRVFCDMDTDGGSWTVIQRREDGSISFYRNWSDYENGFGNTNSEHWLGNRKIHRITSQAIYELRIDMADFDGNTSHAEYAKFRIGDFSTDYKLILGSYSGNAGDSLTRYSGAPFSTKDADHDEIDSNCAITYKGAWWYKGCHDSNLNGQYLGGAHESFADGINWKQWKGYNYSLKYVEMKIRIK
ncbi:fibrinogen C domain-containing protein 1-like [Amphiura filiformis]|uniref:fibrinogen C domain-containing protein 1-like n=1 Tax=Amphiura filiformis TaxID=82378 RepID=UPI003B2263AD